MNDNERRTHETFVRVRDFGVAHAADFPANSLGHQEFTDLGTLATEINADAASEVSGHGDARQGTESRAQARAILRADLDAINGTARVLGQDVPGLEDKFRVPRNNNDKELLNAARAFKADAEPLKTQFIAHEMPADFLEELQADIDSLEAAISFQGSGVSGHVAAGAAIDDKMNRGLDKLRKLNVIVRNKYADNPAVLAEWTSASHIERAPRRSPTSVVPPPPPVPPTPAA